PRQFAPYRAGLCLGYRKDCRYRRPAGGRAAGIDARRRLQPCGARQVGWRARQSAGAGRRLNPQIRNKGCSVDEEMAKPAAKHLDIKAMSFEKALRELESIVGRLERGDVELEESISIYERGEALKDHCDRLLKQAEAKVEKLTFNQAGEPTGTQPFKAQD